jgi:hypothetical protein
METKERNDIISSYGTTLRKYPMHIKSEKVLPYPKGVIRRAIVEELLYTTDPKFWDILASGFASLEDFLPQEEFKIVEPFIESYEKFLMSHRDFKKNQIIDAEQLALEIEKVGFDIITNVDNKITERFSKRVDQLKVLKEMLNE